MPGFDVRFYAGVLFLSTEQTILPTPWSNLEDHLKRRTGLCAELEVMAYVPLMLLLPACKKAIT